MTTFSDIRAVVFDIGGTLLDFEQPESLVQLTEGIRAGYDHLAQTGVTLPSFEHYSAVLRRKAIASLISAKLLRRESDVMRLLRAAHERMGIALDDEASNALCRAVYSPTRKLAHAKPETPDTLATLRDRGYALALVSNTLAPPPGLDEHLDGEGLLPFFAIRVYSCAFGVAKPNPRIFQEALRLLDLPANQCVYIGDKPKVDVKGAKRVGMRTVLRAIEGAPRNVHPKPDAVIREIADLPELLPGVAK